jgi:aspartyl protease family protein
METANIIYSAIVIGLLVMSLLSKGARQDIPYLKYIGYWTGFALILILGYSFKGEFNTIKNRVVGELLPSYATTNKSGEIVLRRSQNGHFYADVYINGQKVRFMVDTGASMVMLTKEAAEKVGINTKTLLYNRPSVTANGTVYNAVVEVGSMSLGPVEFKGVTVYVNPAEGSDTSLLGMAFLDRFDYYRFEDDKLFLGFENVK